MIAGAVLLGAFLESRATAKRKVPVRAGAFGKVRSTDEPLSTQRRRAHQQGRGRAAKAPQEIPWIGWKDVLLRTYEEIGQDRLLAVAAGVVFFVLLAIFPTITALVSLYGLFADAKTIGDHLSLAAGFMPQGAFELLSDQVLRIANADSGGGLTFGFLFGVGVALWSANAGMKAIFDALNVIYDEDETRSFVRLNLITLIFTVGAILIMLLAVGAVVIFPLIFAALGIDSKNLKWLPLLRWPILFCLIAFGLALLYRYGPSRRLARWRWVSVGSIMATVAWMAGSLAFSFYLANFADYNAIYGSLGAAIGLMMWLWLSAIVILVGAELNAEIEHQTARDSTVGHEKLLGMRRAAMADTVGQAKA